MKDTCAVVMDKVERKFLGEAKLEDLIVPLVEKQVEKIVNDNDGEFHYN
ncbi:hypothetical protein [Anaerobacillus alkalidiazotrophicus]|nr:hypothetical protein [Anaerobacillus alkalidiazotrophicus]